MVSTPKKENKVIKATPQRDVRLLRQVAGIILLAVTTLMVVSLLSHSKDDPSWGSSGVQWAAESAEGATTASRVHNLAGTVGAHIGDGLFDLFGGSAYLVPLMCLLFGGIAIKGNQLKPSPVRVAGWTLFFLATPALMALWLSNVWTVVDGRIQYGRAGGVLGDLLTSSLLPYLAQVGTVITLLTLFLLGIIMGPAQTLRGSAGSALAGWQTFNRSLEARRDVKAARQAAAPRNRKLKKTPESAGKSKGPKIIEPETVVPEPSQGALDFMRDTGSYQLPPVTLLDDTPPSGSKATHEELLASSQVLEKKLRDYGVEGEVSQVHPGPVVTMYEFAPAPGVKVSKIAGLADDLALAMSATRVRIVAPIPGKSVVGIEIPNRNREMVAFKELLLASDFTNGKMKIPLALGKDIFGNPVIADLASMPHLLVAGSTGSGKSVGLNSMILSLCFSATPNEIKLAMVDPKMLELSVYDGIPHLIHPVITRPKDAVKLLHRMVIEMMNRYTLMQQAGVRNVNGYNEFVDSPAFADKVAAWREEAIEKDHTPIEHCKLPYIVVVVDELADLMAVASKEIEEPIARLAQMARAAGIHLILATQRPSVDVITGLIKANFPSRIGFQVSSKTDSRTILDSNGAEQLLGKGDMLFLGGGTSTLQRIHGAFVSDEEVHRVVKVIKAQQQPDYDPDLLNAEIPEGTPGIPNSGNRANSDERDVVYDQAIALVASTRKASASFLQRRLRVGYPRAARLVELMEEDGIIGPAEGSRPREVLINAEAGDQTL